MSVYAVSDLHGYPLQKFKELLAKANFSSEDTLYIIGDVIDRNGDGGVEMLRYIMKQPNYEFLIGNHEMMLLACSFLFTENASENDIPDNPDRRTSLERYLRNGGGVTIRNLRKLQSEDSAEFDEIFDFLWNAYVYTTVTAGGREFVLVHGGFTDFSPEKELSEYDPFDLVWERPTLDTEYFTDKLTVIGHTPAYVYGKEHEGRITRAKTWINIDTGASVGFPPALLRLDDLREFYAD